MFGPASKAVCYLVSAVSLVALSGCAAKETTREKLITNTVQVSRVSHKIRRVDAGIELSLTQSYSADYKTTKRTEKKGPVTVANFANDPVYGILTLPFLPFTVIGDVVTGFDNGKIVSEEDMGSETRTAEGPLDNGSPVNGFLTILDGYTEESVVKKPVSLSTSNSKVTFLIPPSASPCVALKFVGEVRTHKRNFDLKMDQRVGCGF